MTAATNPTPPETPATAAPHVLFVTWQDPRSRRYWPVGRLRVFGDGDARRYEFVYLRGAQQTGDAGFRGFVGFPDLYRVYRDHLLFPLFANRLMPRSRPDYGEFVTRLDLDPDTADDMEVLARSGGRRNTDSIEVFAQPDRDRDGCYRSFFLAHGIRYLHPDLQRTLMDSVRIGDRLFLQWDTQNPADHQAMSLRTANHLAAGFVPRYLTDDAWRLQREQDLCGWPIEITVAHVNPAPAPMQQRLVCRMEACWPDGFVPFSGDAYQPVPEDVDNPGPDGGVGASA
ncbi:MAG: DNA-binding protein [Planctomycetota bacterium]